MQQKVLDYKSEVNDRHTAGGLINKLEIGVQ